MIHMCVGWDLFPLPMQGHTAPFEGRLNCYFFKQDCLFIFGCAGSLLVRGLSLVAASGGYSLTVVRGLLIAVASLVAEHGLQEHWLH